VDSKIGRRHQCLPDAVRHRPGRVPRRLPAAGYSKSGKVATYGGLKIPPVTVFMDGFVDGVAYYNSRRARASRCSAGTRPSRTAPSPKSFIDQNKGKSITNTFVARRRRGDAGPRRHHGLGTGDRREGVRRQVSVIWVDQDGCKSAAQYCDVFLTTVVKNINDAVKQAVVTGAEGKALAPTRLPGHAGNNGVSLAPYNQFDSKIDATLKVRGDKLKQDIISGTVKVESANAPQ